MRYPYVLKDCSGTHKQPTIVVIYIKNIKKYERLNNMVLTINQSKFADFVLDNDGKLYSPRYFQESNLTDTAKEVAKIIAKHYLSEEETIIKGTKFHELLDRENIEFDRGVVKAVLELQGNDYFEMSI